MVYDFSHLTIATFNGINDNPVEPTEQKAGNGSHLIAKFNELVEEVVNGLNNSNNQREWTVVHTERGSYTPVSGESVIIAGIGQDMFFIVTLPDSPTPGTNVTVLKTDDSDVVEIQCTRPIHAGYPDRILLANRFQAVTFVWVDDRMGWVASNRDLVIQEGPIS